MYIQIITSNPSAAIRACDEARAIIERVTPAKARLEVRVGIGGEYVNLMRDRCPENEILDTGKYAGCLTGEIFRIAHAACNTFHGEDVIVIAGKNVLDRILRDRFWRAVEYLHDDTDYASIA